MNETEKRRSDRVSLSIPVQVMGTDLGGEDFTAEAKTVLLSRHGATIILNQKLAPNQEIVVNNPAAKREALCRVVGQIGGEAGGYVYGVALLDWSENLWDIEFPPPAEPEEAASRALLRCGSCGSRQVTHLNELELEVFQANRTIALYCKRCRDTTHWKEAEPERERKPEAAPQPSPSTRVGEGGPVDTGIVGILEEPRTQNERKHARVKAAIRACIRQPGPRDEVVTTVDVSRGGFCFRSSEKYAVGLKIDVALPYTPGPANIFAPARIVRSRAIPLEELTEYGVVYIKRP